MEFRINELQIKRLTAMDIPFAQQLFLLFRRVFGEDDASLAGDLYLEQLFSNSGFICFAAIYNDEIIGGLTAFELPKYHAEISEVFIYDIAVKPEFQRIGVGKRLLLTTREYCGIKQIFVDASEHDKHALDFYRSMQGKEEKVIQFTFGR